MRWAGAATDPADPALPEGAHRCRASSRRRPNWRGGWRRSASSSAPTGHGLPRMLKPGQRLVSREGDLWRWDGFAVAAHAPTGAARRLAERGRLLAIESELVIAQSEVEAKRRSRRSGAKPS